MKAATIGTFDGLHKGHRRVLQTLRDEAAKRGLQPMVMTFDRHPLETIAPERAPRAICNPSEKTNELYREGMLMHIIEFTPDTAALTAEEWLRLLHDTLDVRLLVVGYDNTFGSDGVNMSVEDYRQIGERVGIEIVEAPVENGISSSAIRKAIGTGNISAAQEMLGSRFSLTGTVVSGRRLGREIGFPTANIEPAYRAQLPADGVYAALAALENGDTYNAVVNVGNCPTVNDDEQRTVEAHIIGFDRDIYGSRLKLTFLKRLRDEMKFNTTAELKAQIRRDIEAAIRNSI